MGVHSHVAIYQNNQNQNNIRGAPKSAFFHTWQKKEKKRMEPALNLKNCNSLRLAFSEDPIIR